MSRNERTDDEMAKRLISLKRQRAIAARMTLGVVALQAAVLLAFAVTPGEPPAGGTLWQLLWAASRRPTFYPLVALLLAGPPLTVLAWRIAGPHRRWLVAGWVVFLAVAVPLFGHRIWVMLRVLWWRYG